MTSKRSLTRRLIAFMALDEFMPIFPIYALLFSDSGLSTAEISGLLILWSVVTFVLEVPSGAWADVVSRRFLLCLSSVAYGAAFACWMLFPTAVGFAAGFVLWGTSSALSSGTFQALAYDELVAIHAHGEYARVIGVGTSAALIAMTVATLLAAPLVALGGYALAGWASVVVCAVQFLVARSLPATPPVISVADVDDAEELTEAGSSTGSAAALHTGRTQLRARSSGFLHRYFSALRTGTREATRSRLVRGAVLATALLYGMLAFDEYFGLMLSEQGSSLVLIPVLLIVPTAGQAIGGLLATRAATWRPRTIAAIVIVAGLCLAGGALSGHPAGIVFVGLGYGALQLTIVVSDVRLQDSIASDARATVTSVAGFLSELVAVVVYAGFALGSSALSMSISGLVAVLAAVVVLLGPAIARWLPASRPG